MVNGSSIVLAGGIDPIRYFHIELAEHDVIFANGAAAETFVDCDSRGIFHNAAEFAALYPDAETAALGVHVPSASKTGPVAAARSVRGWRRGRRCWRTRRRTDPALCLLADGRHRAAAVPAPTARPGSGWQDGVQARASAVAPRGAGRVRVLAR